MHPCSIYTIRNHNEYMHLLGDQSSDNGSFPIARRDISPFDAAMSPESGKSNNSTSK